MLSNESNEDYSTVYLKTYLMALSDCYDCELDFVKKEILHTRTVYEGYFRIKCIKSNLLFKYNNGYRYGQHYLYSTESHQCKLL